MFSLLQLSQGFINVSRGDAKASQLIPKAKWPPTIKAVLISNKGYSKPLFVDKAFSF